MSIFLIRSLLIFSTALFSTLSNAIDYSKYDWSKTSFDNYSYIDHSKESGDRVVGIKVVTLITFDQISSAQMWGLSVIDENLINCRKRTIQSLKTVWTERKMGRGHVTKSFGAGPISSVGKNFDSTFEGNLFNYICN